MTTIPQTIPKCSIDTIVFLSLNDKNENEAKRKEIIKTLQLSDVLQDICEAIGLKISEVIGPCRDRELCLARHIYCLVARTMLKKTYKVIGGYIGNRDHTTVIHSIKEAVNLIDTDDLEFMDYWERFIKNSKYFTEKDF